MDDRAPALHPRVSVIVCTHAGTLYQRCFDSLALSTGIEFELIVVSSNPYLATEGQWFTILHHEGGPAEKRNVGAARATGEYLVFLDDDVEVRTDTIVQLVKAMQLTPQCGMGHAKILNMERRTELDDCGSWITPTGFLWARAQSQQDEGQFDRAVRCLASKSATCIVDRQAFWAVGGFDPDYFILGEETDLAWRIWLKGWEVWYFPQAVSYHAFNSSLKPTPTYYTLTRIHRYGARNYVSLLLTNCGALRLCALLPLHLCAWAVAIVGFLVRGQFRRALYIMLGLWDAAWLLPRTLAKRHRVQTTRTRSDHDLWRYTSFSPGLDYYLNRLWQYIVVGLHG